MKKNMESFRKHSLSFEGMKLILGGYTSSSEESDAGTITCSITLGGNYTISGECSGGTVQECRNYALNLCVSYSNSGTSCGVGTCS